MNLITAHLLDALTIAGAAVSRTSTLPVLDCVLLEAGDGRLCVTGSDLATEIRTSVPAEISEAGAGCVHAAQLTAVARNAGDGGIELALNGSQLMIRTSHSRHRLNTLAAGDYPATDAPSGGATLSLPASAFADHANHVAHCAAKNDVRIVLNGVHIACEPSAIVFSASDGFRLARSILSVAPDADANSDTTILPVKAVQAITKSLRAGTIDLTITPDAARMEDDRTTITCRCIAGQYPSLDAILSEKSDRIASIESDALAAAVASATPTAGEHGGLRFSLESGMLTLTAIDANGQESVATADCDYDGEPVTTGYNGRFLADAAAHTPGTALLHLPDDAGRGALFIGPESGEYQYCIMPMRL